MIRRDEVVGLLRDGRNVIMTYGWQRGSYGDKDAGFCSVGALRHARRRTRRKLLFTKHEVEVYVAARDMLTQVALTNGGIHDTISYNDNVLTNIDDALGFFDEAIRWLENE